MLLQSKPSVFSRNPRNPEAGCSGRGAALSPASQNVVAAKFVAPPTKRLCRQLAHRPFSGKRRDAGVKAQFGPGGLEQVVYFILLYSTLFQGG
jgi:hypothetical protein